jgi:RNA 3'-terminal phosphate cyclase (ATP)
MFTVDGSQGEGGGQVLRTSLSLSALTGRPFHINKIRANRSRPGLRPQHLTGVRAVAELCQARLDGAELDSTELTFRPGSSPQSGEYQFDVTEASVSGHSAGAVTLIVQAILWPLLFAAGSSRVVLRGGTFVPFSPPFHYLANVAGPAFTRFGGGISVELHSWGWMTAGGGEMALTVEPATRLSAVEFERPEIDEVKGVAAVTNLPSHIPHRMARRAHNLIAQEGLKPSIQPLREKGPGPGAGIVLWIPQAGFSSLGRKGLPADKVAEAAVADLMSFVDNGAAVDYHLADQLLLPMALAEGRSSFTTTRLTRHTETNVGLLRQWLGVAIDVDGALDEPARVSVKGAGFNLVGTPTQDP